MAILRHLKPGWSRRATATERGSLTESLGEGEGGRSVFISAKRGAGDAGAPGGGRVPEASEAVWGRLGPSARVHVDVISTAGTRRRRGAFENAGRRRAATAGPMQARADLRWAPPSCAAFLGPEHTVREQEARRVARSTHAGAEARAQRRLRPHELRARAGRREEHEWTSKQTRRVAGVAGVAGDW